MTEPEQGTQDTISLKCFLCQRKWTGNSKEELTEHLEKAHKVVFKIKELIELSEETDTATNEESRGEKRRLLTVASDTETGVDTTSGDTIKVIIMDCPHNFIGQSGSGNKEHIKSRLSQAPANRRGDPPPLPKPRR